MMRYRTSTKRDGPMGRSQSLEVQGAANRVRFLAEALGVNPAAMVSADLVHGTRIVTIMSTGARRVIPYCDSLITTAPGLPLVITTADCVPVCLWNVKETIAVVLHAGWRGIERNILQNAMNQFSEAFRIQASEVLVWFGPAIGVCHYEIKEDVARIFRGAYPTCVVQHEEKLFLDLVGVLSAQAEALGIPHENIRKNDECTYCTLDEAGEPKYFSARRGNNIQEGELMLTAVTLRAD